MKLCLLTWPFLSLALAPTFAASSTDNTVDDVSLQSPRLNIRDEPQNPKAPAPGDSSTIFNGIEVPRMKNLEASSFEDSIKEGYWYGRLEAKLSGTVSRIEHKLIASFTCRFVKHYSPYCPHCTAIAPTWQTLYEFYYVREYRRCSRSKLLISSRHRIHYRRLPKKLRIPNRRSTLSTPSTISTLLRWTACRLATNVGP
jgi:protein disulfide-isomerase